MAQEVGKLFRVKKQVQGVVPSTQNSEYFELINLGGNGNVDQSAVVNTYKEETKFKTGDILIVEEEVDENLFFDINYPVPPYFTQYAKPDGTFDDNEEPTNWYKKMYGVDTTWELMFNTESVYFRTEGSLADDGRNDGIQNDATRKIDGEVQVEIRTIYRKDSSLYRTSTGANPVVPSGGNIGWSDCITLDNSKQVPIANEIRVKNRLIRIYHLLSINGVNISNSIEGV